MGSIPLVPTSLSADRAFAICIVGETVGDAVASIPDDADWQAKVGDIPQRLHRGPTCSRCIYIEKIYCSVLPIDMQHVPTYFIPCSKIDYGRSVRDMQTDMSRYRYRTYIVSRRYVLTSTISCIQ
jgi:hypothetical protein